MIVDWYDVSESHFGADPTGGAEEIVTVDLRAAGEQDGTDANAAEVWAGGYGFTSRPAAPDGDKACQAIAVDAAGKRIVIAMRDTRGADAHGALNAGDVAMWSTGKNAIRLNADKSIGIIQQGDDSDAALSIEPDGTIILRNAYGQIELGPNGFQVFTKTGEAFQLGAGSANFLAPTFAAQCGTIALGVGAAVPLTIPNPATGGTGTFVLAKPVLNVFV